MSLLTKALPKTVRVRGRELAVQTDFRAILAIYETLMDDTQSEAARALSALRRFYGDALPHDLAAAAGAMRGFLAPQTDGEAQASTAAGEKKPARAPDFSFVTDAPYIYAAILEQYGMDLLNITHLHWHAFLALFAALSPSTRFGEIRAARAAVITADMSPAQKDYLREMKRRFALAPRADADTARLTEALLHGGDLAAVLGAKQKGGHQHGTRGQH